MFFAAQLDWMKYTHVGDITVVGMSILLFALNLQTNLHKNKKFFLMLSMIVISGISSISHIVTVRLVQNYSDNLMLIYSLRLMYYILLLINMLLYIKYLTEPLWLDFSAKKKYAYVSVAAIFLLIILDVCGTIFEFGFVITSDFRVIEGVNTFIPIYCVLEATILYMIIRYRSRLIRQVFWGLLSSNLVSIWILTVQRSHGQTSFTTVCFFLPILGLTFMFHSNPFDIDTGAVSEDYFYTEVNESIEKRHDLIIMSCHMINFNHEIRRSNELKFEFFKFFRNNIKRGVLYRFPNDLLILTFKMRKQTDYESTIHQMLESFRNSYSRFNIDFKIVIAQTTEKLTSSSDYAKLIEFTENKMEMNSIHYINDADIDSYFSDSYILNQLKDIAKKQDVNDQRVRVFCQPVYNISIGTFDTAEALMRLELPDTGMVRPDKFIPLAEQYGLIHQLSMIILNKTCHSIRGFIDHDFNINRISVNFSVLDLRYESFISDVTNIIKKNNIPFNKIAIEITESRSDFDFNIMKSKIIELKKLGIKFYLDDFGTGYSNFERIMEIPFDIIKFDRSLLIESLKSEHSEFMVSTFAEMFTKLDYAILFEGVENDRDEKYCTHLKAKYLQGFKYSKPIPIEELEQFIRSIPKIQP